MKNALSHISHEPPRPPRIIPAASDALDEFLPEEALPGPPAPSPPPVTLGEPPLFKYVDARAPVVDLAADAFQSIGPAPAKTAPSHPRVARVVQALVGALLVITATRAYQLYVPGHTTGSAEVGPPTALETIAVTGSRAEPAAETPAPLTNATTPVEPDVPKPKPPSPSSARVVPDRAKTETTARGVIRETRTAGSRSGPAQLNPEAAAMFWTSRGGRASEPPAPPPLPSGGQAPALEGTRLSSLPPPAPPPAAPSAPSAATANAPIPVANPPAFIAPSSPVRITPAPGESAPPTATPSPRESDMAAIETVLTQYRIAFANLDAGAVAVFWPSVNSRTLNRAFDQLEVQKFEFDRCTTDLKGATATTNCNGRARYTPRIGNKTPRVEPRRWTFTMEKANGTWIIRRVDSARTGS